VNPHATVERSEHLRLFYGLPLPADAAATIARWAREALAGRRGVRVLAPEHLHVTLAFLGYRPASELDVLREALRAAAAGMPSPELAIERYRETDRVGMLVLSDREDHATRLQARLAERLAALGVYRPERRPWLAHVTVARFRERPRLRPPFDGRARVSPSEAALYHSVLRSSGAQYHIVESVFLGG
jgi:RNA 2',3'-cyclic 3'-phosphodiesterase